MASTDFEEEEFEVLDIDEDEDSSEVEAKKPKPKVEKEDDDDIEIEEYDDTPEADRNRKPLPKEIVDEVDSDDLSEYSERVKTRMSQLRKVYHDERREKENAAREALEAVRYAQAVADENKKLKNSLTYGEKSYIEVSVQAAQHELNNAKQAYREAYDNGDTDKLIDAQEKMYEAQQKVSQVKNYRPQYESALQNEENNVKIQPERPQAVTPDKKALLWEAQNEWFGQNNEMTSLALGLHEDLVRSGVNPTSDKYYSNINATMRKRFPEYFEEKSLDEDKPAQRRTPSTVVAPATRSTAPKQVRLSKTQRALAKKLGLTNEQYARETLKLENT
tara:strand:- start:2705 stop:3703 length:999 start_codon:yes stop_codon:yes gene_type:complete